MKSVAITGANGFCGRAMARFIEERGVAVTALNRRDFYLGAVSPSAAAIASRLRTSPPDAIFHFAGTSHSGNAAELYEANFLTALALFEAVRGLAARPVIVVCGSAAEYGPITSSDLPLSEGRVARPADVYGASKLAQTHLALLAAQAGCAVIVTRPFNIIGPRMPTRLALGGFLDQIARAVPEGRCQLRVGNLHTSRDFIAIDDALRAWWDLAHQPEAQGGIVNICSGVPVSIGELLAHVAAASPIPIDIVSDPARMRANDTPVHFGDNTRLRELLGWVPTAPDRAAIERIVQLHLALSCAP